MNQYVEEFMKLADENRSEYRGIKAEIDKAKEKMQEVQGRIFRNGRTPMLKAEEDLANQKIFESREKLRKFKWKGEDLYDKAVSIKNRYAKSLEDKFVVDPNQLDQATIKLLDSGILKPNDYIHLFEKAKEKKNITMMRLIAKSASEYDTNMHPGGDEGRRLRVMESEARQMIGGERLTQFSGAVEAFHRRVREPLLNDTATWDTMVKPVLESLDD